MTAAARIEPAAIRAYDRHGAPPQEAQAVPGPDAPIGMIRSRV